MSRKKKSTISVLEKLRNDGFLYDQDLEQVKDELQLDLEKDFFDKNIELDQLVGKFRYQLNDLQINMQEINNLFFNDVLST